MEKRPKTIIYKGVKYTINKGYYKTTASLHRKIWEDHYGDIPDDHHIHHKNGDSLDNRIENLECIHRSKHHSMHFCAIRQAERLHSKESRLKAREWYLSDEGRKVQSAASKKGWYRRKHVERSCIVCGDSFITKNLNGTKYCSPLCRSRCQMLRETIQKGCIICGQIFKTRNYLKSGKTCSQKCKGRLISQSKLRDKNDIISSTK